MRSFTIEKEDLMKKIKICLTLASLLLIAAMVLGLSSCSLCLEAKDLMADVTPNRVEPMKDLSGHRADVTDFAVRLLVASAEENGNTLISPVSLLCALAMTLNGAEGETKEQIETAVGMSVEELNIYLYSYVNSLPEGDGYKLSLANSIWFREAERFEPNEDFLQTNADYYGADIYEAAFDKTTVKDVNKWIDHRTDGMIPDMLDGISDDTVMLLINALAFDAKWQEEYEKNQIREGTFTNADGTESIVDFMYSNEYDYLDDGSAKGFIKPYMGGKYAFAALLPNEGITVEEYLARLDGETLAEMLSAPQSTSVSVAIPQFETTYDREMSGVLETMGIVDLFAYEKADLSGLGNSAEGNIYVSEALHRTYISVDDKGTKAAAVTIFVAKNGDGEAMSEKTVCLDRPFIYMLIDTNTNIPFFIGIMNNVSG